MLNRTGIRWNRYSWWLALALGSLGVGATLVAGCGGGGGSSTATPTPTPTSTAPPVATTKFRATILWGQRTRLEGLSSALSARITLLGSAAGGSDVSFVVNRDAAKLAAYQGTYESPVASVVGVYRFTVRFFSQPNAAGSEVGFADASATLSSDGSLSTTIATYGGVRSVTVLPGQRINLFETKDIAYTATDSLGNVLALSTAGGTLTPGSGQPAVVSGFESNIRIEANGQITALRPSRAKITVRVDAITSAAETVAIDSPVVLTVAPASVNPLGWENSVQLTPTLTGLPPNLGGADLGVTYAIENDSGSVGTISATGLYTAPKADVDLVVVVTSNFDPAKVVRVPISVRSLTDVLITAGTPGAPVALAPDVNLISVKQVVAFSAKVVNGFLTPANQKVTWTLEGPNGEANTASLYGSITTAGVYTAPATRPGASGLCRVRVVPAYDPSKAKIVPIQIVEGSVGVIIR